jgi:hypothetical protein
MQIATALVGFLLEFLPMYSKDFQLQFSDLSNLDAGIRFMGLATSTPNAFCSKVDCSSDYLELQDFSDAI